MVSVETEGFVGLLLLLFAIDSDSTKTSPPLPWATIDQIVYRLAYRLTPDYYVILWSFDTVCEES
jgi:hypothetical protein